MNKQSGDPIAEKLREAYHNDLTDVPLLLEAADKIDKLSGDGELLVFAAEKIDQLTKERDEARQTLSDWTTDIGVRGFARRSELDAAKAEVERLLVKGVR
jgi:hypothetical protein